MTQQEKQLLLRDLSARVPYGVIVHRYSDNCYSDNCDISIDNVDDFAHFLEYSEGEEFKPYLRPLSSITEEEKNELRQEHVKDEKLYAECLTKAANGDNSMRGKVIPHFAADWCNKNHFDYRGLIPMGLALEAPEGMYKIQ